MDFRAESAKALEAINDELHDRWFDVTDIEFSQLHGQVRVRFRRSIKGNNSDIQLEIAGVDDFVLEESEGVGVYDFNRLALSARTGALRVETGIPLRFEMHVSRLAVRLRSEPTQ